MKDNLQEQLKSGEKEMQNEQMLEEYRTEWKIEYTFREKVVWHEGEGRFHLVLQEVEELTEVQIPNNVHNRTHSSTSQSTKIEADKNQKDYDYSIFMDQELRDLHAYIANMKDK